MDAKFTCLSFEGNKVVTGDTLGRITVWRLANDASSCIHHEVIGDVKEKIVDIYSSGPTTFCRTKSGKIYYWTMHSVRNGFEFDLEVVDCELINTIPCPKHGEGEEAELEFDYSLSNRFNRPTLEVYTSHFMLEFIDIESGETERASDISDCDFSFWAPNRFIEKGGYYITPVGVWDIDSGTRIARYENYGEEFASKNFSSYVVFNEMIYSAGSIRGDDLFAFIDVVSPFDDIEDIEDIEEFYFVRVAKIDCSDMKWDYDLFEEPQDYSFGEKWDTLDFKIKRSEAEKLSFYHDKMATITKKGVVKVFDIRNKALLCEIKALQKIETNEFGEEF